MIPIHIDTTPEIAYVARVIYSEASPICSATERHLVASVIFNRVNHPGFNRLKTPYEVVSQPNQFSCVGDRKNTNWWRTEEFIQHQGVNTDDEYIAWVQSIELAKGNFVPVPEIVYYHDVSITTPKSWNNKWWNVAVQKETKHFIFYRIFTVKDLATL